VVGLIGFLRRPENRVVWWLVSVWSAFGAGRALGEDVIIVGSVSGEEAKGLFGQWKPARVPEVGRTQTELNPHVSDLRIYRRFGRANNKLADQTMIICVRGAS
jgi:hypothetical protein